MLYLLLVSQSEENELQRSIYTLRTLCQKYNFKISNTKTKVMDFLGENSVRTKIIIDNSVLEQVSHFNYLGCDISYRKDNDIKRMLNTFSYTCGTIR